MNFEFSDEQKMLRDQAQRFLRENCTSALVREVMESEQGYDRALWTQLSEMGWHGIAIPEEFGGLGGGYLELCILAEQLGRFLAPVPFAATQYLATRALLLTGSEQQKAAWLPEVAAGERIGCLALAERPGSLLQRQTECFVAGGRLHGSKTPVMDGAVADFALISARSSAAADAPVALYLVDLCQPGVQRSALPVIDGSRPHARLGFEGIVVEPLHEGGDYARQVAAILDGAATLLAFEQVGGADATLEMACAFALERKAFGRPIGGFQAVKHKLADMYVKNELARANAYYAAWALASGDAELALAAPAARIAATDAFEYATQENIQIHGGMGYTWEVDAHLFYRRSRSLAQVIGSAREWKERLTSRLVARLHQTAKKPVKAEVAT
ncbi:MAG: acyl-CoA dehydrogenase family protein [Rhodocyclaceae bacterium]|jgi:alkylation response protein AidB-like acyl-CoA dehydrogenase|nr:acyl-CoA dehydrogenase family protein [Rhodocyclaceae bacterium]